MHVYGAWHTVGPVYPVPPHCPKWVWEGPVAVVVVEDVVVEELAVVDELGGDVVVTTPVPFPTLVVMGPLSM